MSTSSYSTYSVRLIVMLGLMLTPFLIAPPSVAFATAPSMQEQDVDGADNEVAAEDDQWTEDVEKAIKTAKTTKKDLVLLFTGSDWCPPCKRLEKEVLGQKDFQFEVTQQFVLVKFDFLRNTPQDETIAGRNRKWAQDYGVEGYPTVICVDKDLKPYGITGYQAGGVENYLAILEEFRQARITRDEKLAAANKVKGLDRAKLLDEAIAGIDELIVEVYYPEIVKEIVELDKNDDLGLRSKWNAAQEAEMRKIVMTDILMISRLEKPAKAIAFIDEIMGEFQFPSRQKLAIYQIKLNLVRKLDDTDKLDALLDEMINLEGVEGETRERLQVKKIYALVGTKRRADAMKMLETILADGEPYRHLWKAKGDLLASDGKFAEAVKAYDQAINASANAPDVLIEVVGAKADTLFELKDAAGALQTLDNFADDTNQPSDLRSEALLHKAMIMRDMNRRRQARIAENSAIEVTESAAERAEIEKMVQRLRAKYGDQ